MRCLLYVDGRVFKTLERAEAPYTLRLPIRPKFNMSAIPQLEKVPQLDPMHTMEFELVDRGRAFAIYNFVGVC
jgi:hypothetical protein